MSHPQTALINISAETKIENHGSTADNTQYANDDTMTITAKMSRFLVKWCSLTMVEMDAVIFSFCTAVFSLSTELRDADDAELEDAEWDDAELEDAGVTVKVCFLWYRAIISWNPMVLRKRGRFPLVFRGLFSVSIAIASTVAIDSADSAISADSTP